MSKTNKKISVWFTICILLGLNGCSWLGIRDRSNDYLLAEEIQPIVVPVEMNSSELGQKYPIPYVQSQSIAFGNYGVQRPEPISDNAFEKSVKIQSVGDERWVLINISPSQLWPRIRHVLNQNGITTAKVEGTAGVIETMWFHHTPDAEHSHRYRFSVVPGIQSDSTEIFVLHQKVARESEDNAVWPKQSDSETRESDMLLLIASDLAASPDHMTASLLAQYMGHESKADLVIPKVADPFILIKLDFERSWLSVDYSLSRGGFVTIDKDPMKGVFFVNYSKSEHNEVFFERWFVRSDTKPLEINYHVLVQSVGTNVEVRIVGVQGESLDKSKSIGLLKILRNNMS